MVNLIDGDGDGDLNGPPKLPPRTGTGLSMQSGHGGRGSSGANLMDDEPGEDLMKGWEVLRPSL